MTPLEPAELSAYLDGEVSAVRAREIAAIVAADPALIEELDALGRDDAAWRAAARSAAFAPVVRLEPARGTVVSAVAIVAFVGLLVVVAGAVRTLDNFALAIALNLAAAALVSLGVFVLARADLAAPDDAPAMA